MINRLKELLIGISDPLLRSNQSSMTQPVNNVRQTVISQKKKSKIAQLLLKGSRWLRDFNIPMRDEYKKLNLKKTQWWQPQHCYVYPNVARIMAKYLLEHNDTAIKVESIITTGEQLFD